MVKAITQTDRIHISLLFPLASTSPQILIASNILRKLPITFPYRGIVTFIKILSSSSVSLYEYQIQVYFKVFFKISTS